MEKLLLAVLKNKGLLDDSGWVTDHYYRHDFLFKVGCDSDSGEQKSFVVSVEDVFEFLYSNASGQTPAAERKDDEIR